MNLEFQDQLMKFVNLLNAPRKIKFLQRIDKSRGTIEEYF